MASPASRRRLRCRQILLVSGLAWIPLWAAFALQEEDLGEAAPEAAKEPPPSVFVIEVDSAIQPVAAEFVVQSLEEADRRGAAAFILQLNTPGGLLPSTQIINSAILGARVPVVVYVSPSGSHAASAGFFILMAADVAAMAPGTRTGAAHPVGPQGQDVEGTMGEKVEQDAAADIRALAARNGRDEKLAEEAVLKSRSFTAQEALELGLVDLIAPSLSSLLDELDGREVIKADRTELTLDTAQATIESLEMTPSQRFRSVIADPNIAVLLLSLGGLGLMLELYNPGAILPGVVGAICIIVGFYALSILPVNYAGLALIVLALILFIAEIQVQSFGLLTLGGVVSLVLGGTMLIESPDPALRVGLDIIITVAVVAVLLVTFLATMVVRAQSNRVRTGKEGLLRERGVARSALEPRGKVSVHGEIWSAVAHSPNECQIAAGDPVEVVAVEGMTLRVRPLKS